MSIREEICMKVIWSRIKFIRTQRNVLCRSDATWRVTANQRPASRSRDHSQPIRGQWRVTARLTIFKCLGMTNQCWHCGPWFTDNVKIRLRIDSHSLQRPSGSYKGQAVQSHVHELLYPILNVVKSSAPKRKVFQRKWMRNLFQTHPFPIIICNSLWYTWYLNNIIETLYLTADCR